MASASESGDGAASCDLAGRFSSCSSMKSGAPGDATWRRLALVIVTNSVGLVLVRQKRPACGARGMRARALSERSPGTTWQVSHAWAESWGTRRRAVGRPDGAAGVVGPHLQLVAERYHHIYDGKKHTRERERGQRSGGGGTRERKKDISTDKGAKRERNVTNLGKAKVKTNIRGWKLGKRGNSSFLI